MFLYFSGNPSQIMKDANLSSDGDEDNEDDEDDDEEEKKSSKQNENKDADIDMENGDVSKTDVSSEVALVNGANDEAETKSTADPVIGDVEMEEPAIEKPTSDENLAESENVNNVTLDEKEKDIFQAKCVKSELVDDLNVEKKDDEKSTETTDEQKNIEKPVVVESAVNNEEKSNEEEAPSKPVDEEEIKNSTEDIRNSTEDIRKNNLDEQLHASV